MKNPKKIRFLGMILLILSSLGILFAIVGITTLWIIRPRLLNGIGSLLDSFDATLATTDKGLDVLDGAVQDSITNLGVIDDSLENLGKTLDGVSASLESSATLVGDDLRLTIIGTQTALNSASTSAVIIDNTLKTIASIPLIGKDYQPDVPLHTSLEQVAGSLEDVPETLETIELSLKDTITGLDSLKTDLSTLRENIGNVEEDLESAQQVIDDYHDVIKKASIKLENFRAHFSTFLFLSMIILSGMLFWLAFAQLSVLIQGIKYWQGDQHLVNLADIQRNDVTQ